MVSIFLGTGTFRIAGIMKITNSDGKINHQSGIMMALAMKYAVETFNQSYNLHGYNLGHEIYDYKTELDVETGVLNVFLDEIPFLIGPYSSQTSHTARTLTGNYHLLSISYSATYSDFKNGLHNGYMFRTVPSDLFRVSAGLDFLKKMKWNYVGVISSYNFDGERDAEKFVEKLSTADACFAEHNVLPEMPEKKDYVKAIDQMNLDKRLKVIVLFTTNEDSHQILSEIKNKKLAKRFYILCMYGCANYVEVTDGVEEVAAGVISLDIHYPEVTGFKEYFMKQKPTPESPEYFKKYWESVFKCHLNPGRSASYSRTCSGKEHLSEEHYHPLTPVATVVNAVGAFADTIQAMASIACNSERKHMENESECILKPAETHVYSAFAMKIANRVSKITPDGTILHQNKLVTDQKQQVRYDFHQFVKVDGNFKRNFIGRWSISLTPNDTAKSAEEMLQKERPVLNFNKGWKVGRMAKKMTAICSRPCPAGYSKEPDSNLRRAKCCWSCTRCIKWVEPDNTVLE